MDLIKLGKILKEKRDSLNLSLRVAGEKIGISHNYLSIIEKAKDPRSDAPIRPTIDTLKLISDAYNMDINDILPLAGYEDIIIYKSGDEYDIAQDNNLIRDGADTFENSKYSTELTKKDEREIEKIITGMRESLTKQDGLMLSGEPASDEALESILDALEYGMRQAKRINKKYTPKKYRK